MFLLDSLMISGISWTLRTVVAAAEAEMNDDTALREQLLAAEMQRELGEISDEEFADIERDVLARIREVKERREGGAKLVSDIDLIPRKGRKNLLAGLLGHRRSDRKAA